MAGRKHYLTTGDNDESSIEDQLRELKLSSNQSETHLDSQKESDFAFRNAYAELQRRYNDLDKKNRTLQRQLQRKSAVESQLALHLGVEDGACGPSSGGAAAVGHRAQQALSPEEHYRQTKWIAQLKCLEEEKQTLHEKYTNMKIKYNSLVEKYKAQDAELKRLRVEVKQSENTRSTIADDNRLMVLTNSKLSQNVEELQEELSDVRLVLVQLKRQNGEKRLQPEGEEMCAPVDTEKTPQHSGENFAQPDMQILKEELDVCLGNMQALKLVVEKQNCIIKRLEENKDSPGPGSHGSGSTSSVDMPISSPDRSKQSESVSPRVIHTGSPDTSRGMNMGLHDTSHGNKPTNVQERQPMFELGRTPRNLALRDDNFSNTVLSGNITSQELFGSSSPIVRARGDNSPLNASEHLRDVANLPLHNQAGARLRDNTTAPRDNEINDRSGNVFFSPPPCLPPRDPLKGLGTHRIPVPNPGQIHGSSSYKYPIMAEDHTLPIQGTSPYQMVSSQHSTTASTGASRQSGVDLLDESLKTPEKSTYISGVDPRMKFGLNSTNTQPRMQLCPICSEDFSHASMSAFQAHVFDCYDNAEDDHEPTTMLDRNTSQRTCPMCAERFPLSITQDMFVRHVDGHFEPEFEVITHSPGDFS